MVMRIATVTTVMVNDMIVLRYTPGFRSLWIPFSITTLPPRHLHSRTHHHHHRPRHHDVIIAWFPATLSSTSSLAISSSSSSSSSEAWDSMHLGILNMNPRKAGTLCLQALTEAKVNCKNAPNLPVIPKPETLTRTRWPAKHGTNSAQTKRQLKVYFCAGGAVF